MNGVLGKGEGAQHLKTNPTRSGNLATRKMCRILKSSAARGDPRNQGGRGPGGCGNAGTASNIRTREASAGGSTLPPSQKAKPMRTTKQEKGTCSWEKKNRVCSEKTTLAEKKKSTNAKGSKG